MTSIVTQSVEYYVAASPLRMPAGFGGNRWLYMWNLFLMTAAAHLGIMMFGKIWRELRANADGDRWSHPVTIWRVAFLLASLALFIRCGAEAMLLWSWNSLDDSTTAHIIMLKRWLDPVAVFCGFGWMALVLLSSAAMEAHLSRRPLPVDIWAKRGALIRPALVVLLCFVVSAGVVLTRG